MTPAHGRVVVPRALGVRHVRGAAPPGPPDPLDAQLAALVDYARRERDAEQVQALLVEAIGAATRRAAVELAALLHPTEGELLTMFAAAHRQVADALEQAAERHHTSSPHP